MQAITDLQNIVQAMKDNTIPTIKIVGVFWGIHLVNFIIGYRFNYLGIYPRNLVGLVGILTAPFLHGSFSHLFFNSIPLAIMVNLLLIHGFPFFILISGLVMGLMGLATWIFGRKALHVGASGLIMGYWSYLLADAVQTKSASAIILAALVLYYFGGLAMQILPIGERKTSFESHFFGFLSGIATAFVAPIIIIKYPEIFYAAFTTLS